MVDRLSGRPFDLKRYLAIVFGLSWPFQFGSVLGPDTLAWACIFNSISMMMVGVGTFICGQYVFRDGFSTAGWKWGCGRYYAFGIGLPLGLWLAPALIDLAIGSIDYPDRLTTSQMLWVLEMLFVVLIPAFGEEIGWRGYMLPRMALIMSPRRAVVWHGVIWYVWHLPIVGSAFVSQMGGDMRGAVLAAAAAAALLFGAVLVIVDAAIFAWLWAASGSIGVVTVFHAASDGFRDSLSITLGSGHVGDVWAPILTLLVGCFILWKTDWNRLLGRRSDGRT